MEAPDEPKIDGLECRAAAAAHAAAAARAEERVSARAVGGGVRIAHDAAHLRLQVQLVDLVLLRRDGLLKLVLLKRRELLVDVRVDRGDALGVLVLGPVDGALRGAAALGKLLGERVVAVLHGLLRAGEVAQVLVAHRCQALRELHHVQVLVVAQTPHGVLQVVEVHGAAQPRLGDGLAVRHLAIAPQAAAQREQQDDDPPGAVRAAEAVVVARDRSDVGKAHSVVHFVLLYV